METCEKVKRKKRKFCEGWLDDERYRPWIRKVSGDNSLFHCVICAKNFSCSSSHALRHAKSAHHRKNTGKLTSPNNDSLLAKKKPFRRKIFRQQWLEIKELKPWLREVHNDANSFFCTICDKVVVGGLSQIYRHGESKIHKDKFEKCVVIEQDDSKEELNIQIDESFLPFENKKKLAEIRFAALIADKNIPLETAKMILNFFQDIGTDSNVLKCMTMGRTKCSNIISNVLCPVETACVVENIQDTKFSVFVDEMSDVSNGKWGFYVRYVNPETLQIHSQLVKVIGDETDSTGEKLFNAFEHELLKLQIRVSNMIALSCDNHVMTEKYLYFFKKKVKEMFPKVLILSCPCNSATLAVHAACAKIPKVCEEFVKLIANFLNSRPKHIAISLEFSEFFQEGNKVFKLPDMRWLSYHAFIEKLLSFWDIIKQLLNETIANCEKKRAMENLLCTMENIEVKAYLLFLKYILHSFNMFNTFFQAVETRTHLLQPKSIELLTSICKNFLKEQVAIDFLNTPFDKTENQKCLTDVYLGLECEEYLCQVTMDGYVNAVVNVRKNCLEFYVTAAEEICKKLPVDDTFLSKLKVFLPDIALSNIGRITSFDDVSYIAKTIGDFDKKALEREWFTLGLDFTPSEKEHLSGLNFDDMWIVILQSRYSTNELRYPNLKSLLISVKSLPNSNADPERIFSFLTDISAKKRNKLSSTAVNAICVLKSALKTRGETALNMKIDTNHLSLMSSDKLYTNMPKKPKNNLQKDDDIADFP